MPIADAWAGALSAATAIHAGFQLTVTLLVYPALGDVDPQSWRAAHARHSRRIVPLVAMIYLGLLVSLIGSLVTGLNAFSGVAAVATALVVGLTGLVAAPLHARLESARDAGLLRLLIRTDRLRTALALLALAAALAGGFR